VSAKNKKGGNEVHRKPNTRAMQLDSTLPQVALGSDSAWSEYRRRTLAVVAGIVNGTEVSADDVVQAVMLRAWARRSQFKGESEFTTWLYRISVNAAVDFLRKIRSNVLSLEELSFDGDDPTARIPEPKAPGVDIHKIIQAQEILNRLSPKNATIVKLWMHDESPELIGQRLGIDADAVRKRISRALRGVVKRSQQENQTHVARSSRKPSQRSGSQMRRAADSQKE
jgi:RNA polymerase sigma factor (sigma-70 family)